MRAVVVENFGPVETIGIGTLPDPVPSPGEVLIDVKAVAVNYVDLLVITGKYQFLPKLPFAPGKGPAGLVTALGSNVTRLKIGDRVLAMAEQGGYAERVAVAENQCYRLPADMACTTAASMAVAYDTAWFALCERARYKPGETVLVLGATGAVGDAAVQVAKAKGARVLAGVSSSAKADLARQSGADAVIDLSMENLRDGLRARVHELTQGRGADIILDPLGGDIFDAALRALAWRGRLVVIGFAAGRIPTVKVNYLLLKNIEVSGLQISDYRKRMPEAVAAAFADLFALCSSGKVKPPPPQVYPLERAVEALVAIRDRRAPGRIVLSLE